jgi:hypothetical protein
MQVTRSAAAGLLVVAAVAGSVLVGAGQQPTTTNPNPLPLAPLGVRGESIYTAYEGWGPHKDGSNVLLIGYMNRNREQTLDIPVGPNNRIEPGGPDYGQPTHFLTGRQYGVFAIPVPKDFGNKKLTWTITANGRTTQVQFGLVPPYWIDFFKNTSDGNEPPVIKFSENGPELTGPPLKSPQLTLSGTVGQPVPIKLWVRDQPRTTVFDPNPPQRGRGRGGDTAGRGADDPAGRGADAAARGRGGAGGGGGGGRGGGGPRGDVTIVWSKYRGPGEVKIEEPQQALFNKGDAKLVMEAATTATFSAPGEYWIIATAQDQSGAGGGGDQCCWTTGHIRVNVK